MPLKIGKYVITGSRGALLEPLFPQRKDAYKWDPEPALRSAPKDKGKLPRVDIRAITAESHDIAYPTYASIDKAIAALPEYKSADELAAAFIKHMDKRFSEIRKADPEGRKRLIIVVGEKHRKKAGIVAIFTALAWLKAQKALVSDPASGQTPALLLEHNQQEVDRITERLADVRQDLIKIRARPGREARRQGMEVFALKSSSLLTANVAQLAGFALKSFDPLYETAEHRGQREYGAGDKAGMMQAIDAILAEPTTGPVIIRAGGSHVPAIHQHLEATTSVIAMANATPVRDSPHHRRRKSFVLSHPEVMAYRVRGVEKAPLDIVKFTSERGLDILPTASSGIASSSKT